MDCVDDVIEAVCWWPGRARFFSVAQFVAPLGVVDRFAARFRRHALFVGENRRRQVLQLPASSRARSWPVGPSISTVLVIRCLQLQGPRRSALPGGAGRRTTCTSPWSKFTSWTFKAGGDAVAKRQLPSVTSAPWGAAPRCQVRSAVSRVFCIEPFTAALALDACSSNSSARHGVFGSQREAKWQARASK